MPDLTPETIAELERLRIGRAKHLAKTTLRDPSSIHGRGSVLEQDLAGCILALLAERERLREAVAAAVAKAYVDSEWNARVPIAEWERIVLPPQEATEGSS